MDCQKDLALWPGDLQLPLGFAEQAGVIKNQIVHNESNLTMNVGTNNSQSKVFFTKVKARHLGEAIITSTVCNCNQNNIICESCKKNAHAMSFFGRHVDFWSVTYVIGYRNAFVSSILILKSIASWMGHSCCNHDFVMEGSKPPVAQCGLAYCDFRRRRFFENRLAMMIHQTNIRSHKCRHGRLRLSFKRWEARIALQWYNAYLICILCIL